MRGRGIVRPCEAQPFFVKLRGLQPQAAAGRRVLGHGLAQQAKQLLPGGLHLGKLFFAQAHQLGVCGLHGLFAVGFARLGAILRLVFLHKRLFEAGKFFCVLHGNSSFLLLNGFVQCGKKAVQRVAPGQKCCAVRAQGGHACLAAQSGQRAYLRQRHAQRAVEQDALQRIHLCRAVQPVARLCDARGRQEPYFIVIMKRAHRDARQGCQLFYSVFHGLRPPFQNNLTR